MSSRTIRLESRACARRAASAAACLCLLVTFCAAVPRAPAADNAKLFLGSWALTIPGGAAGWLGVEEKDGGLQASLLWGGGSVLPLASAKVEGDQLVLTRRNGSGRKRDAATTDTITARVSGDNLDLTLVPARGERRTFTGKRTPAPPPAPDLAKVKFGDPIKLFNGKDLTGWKLTSPGQTNGWSVEDGILKNTVVQEPGKQHKPYGNLRTEQAFEDFKLSLETRVPPGGNSGVYLRGIYEIQVADTYGRRLDPHNMGAVYSRICPTASAEKPAGQWQTLAMTLVDRHITIVLNGTKIIDNQPVAGCTGGALWSDPFRPGPIYLQGDHTGIDYRNIVLCPVVK